MEKESIEKIISLLEKREETRYIYENSVKETLNYTHTIINVNDKNGIISLSKQNGLWPTIITYSGTLELKWIIENKEIKHKKISFWDILKMAIETNIDFYDKLPLKLRSDKKLVEILNQSEYKYSWLGILSSSKYQDEKINLTTKPILLVDVSKKDFLEYLQKWENKYITKKTSKL